MVTEGEGWGGGKGLKFLMKNLQIHTFMYVLVVVVMVLVVNGQRENRVHDEYTHNNKNSQWMVRSAIFSMMMQRATPPAAAATFLAPPLLPMLDRLIPVRLASKWRQI